MSLEEEPVELRLGQRVGALHLERVLRREHEERRVERVAVARDGDLVLLHRLEQRDCVFGVARLISSASTMFAKIGPGWKWKTRGAALLDEDVRADDVGGHQVGRELDAGERAVDDVGERAHEHRLAEAGHALEQHVAVGEQADERVPHELALADDDLADLGLDRPRALGEGLGCEAGRRGRRGAGAGRGGGCVHGSSGVRGGDRCVVRHCRGSSELK